MPKKNKKQARPFMQRSGLCLHVGQSARSVLIVEFCCIVRESGILGFVRLNHKDELRRDNLWCVHVLAVNFVIDSNMQRCLCTW